MISNNRSKTHFERRSIHFDSLFESLKLGELTFFLKTIDFVWMHNLLVIMPMIWKVIQPGKYIFSKCVIKVSRQSK